MSSIILVKWPNTSIPKSKEPARLQHCMILYKRHPILYTTRACYPALNGCAKNPSYFSIQMIHINAKWTTFQALHFLLLLPVFQHNNISFTDLGISKVRYLHVTVGISLLFHRIFSLREFPSWRITWLILVM